VSLPEVLAGPVLRRAEPGRVLLWLATSRPVTLHGEIVSLEPRGGGEGPRRLGRGGARRVRLGPRLFVHLVSVLPDPAVGAFPSNHLLGYDLVLGGGDAAAGHPPRRLGDLGLLAGSRAVTLGDLPLPSFFLPARSSALNLLHGSCRLLHGHGEDALLAADELLTQSARDLGRRPSALVLTGDQIYGDEVAGPMIGHLTRLGAELLGAGDTTSVPGVPALDRLPLYGRQELSRELGFTSGKAANHLFSLGEFAAMYLVAWDEANWPERLPDSAEALAPGARGRLAARQRRQYSGELAGLEQARRALPAARRVLANVPTYMIFDDHDVTDDWNLTCEWHDQVWRSPGGRRVVANALAAYWAFQGWGNAPESFDEQFLEVVTAGPSDERFDRAMWSFDRWSYHAPTDPPLLVLNTRTQRAFDSERGAARLLGDAELDRVRELARRAGVRAPGPAVLVSATPVYGLELQERRQKFLVDKVDPYEIDFEAWHSNLAGLCDFMRLLIDELGLRSCVILSGDVHYGLNVQATFGHDDQVVSIAQLVSSGLKHSGALARTGLHLLGAAVRPDHARVGWETPPAVPEASRASRLLGRLRRRAVNTDAWAQNAPVFLTPTLAERIAAEQPPCFEETRSYVRTDGHRHRVVIGDNNVGLVSVRLRDGVVVHRLLVRRAGRTMPHTASLTLRSAARLPTTE
jgi:PhoD-like phosphatase